MRPNLRAFMRGANSRQTRNAVVRFAAITRLHCSSLTSSRRRDPADSSSEVFHLTRIGEIAMEESVVRMDVGAEGVHAFALEAGKHRLPYPARRSGDEGAPPGESFDGHAAILRTRRCEDVSRSAW
jgi:hypothetical protein